jgi:hypothetical protein
MRIVDDGGEHFAGAVQAPGLFDETLLAAEVCALAFDLKGLAQDAQRAVVGVQSPVDDRGHEAFGVVLAQGAFDDALAGAGLSDDDAQAPLLAVDAQSVQHFALVREKGQALG